ncbi:MAG: thioesterase [Lachnospiraceae bacterium]|nr:thioesterase [Lachnospiraceae bacterium]
MEYRIHQRVRYSEIGADQKVNMAQIVKYFQDCSTFQSEDIGCGFHALEKKQRAWLLLGWQIIADRYPAFGEEISIGTWAYDWKGIYGYRNFDIQDSTGKRIAYANSIWVYTDTQTLAPVKIDPEEVEAYGSDPCILMDYAPRKIRAPKEFKESDPFQIMKTHIDTNHHVNNAQYIDLAEELLPEGFSIHQVRAEYKHSAVLHDMIYPRITQKDRTCTIQLCNDKGIPYVIVEFKEKE